MPDAQPAPAPRTTLLVLTLLSVLAFMDRQIVAVLLLPVKTEFALTDLQVGLVTGLGFAAAFGVLAVPLARVADRHERRALVAWCRGLGGVLAALGAAAGNAWTLMLTRAGGALSDAGGSPASMSMIADLFPPAQRTRAMGVFTMGASLGALIALVGGSWFAQHYGWRATLVAIGAASLAAALTMRLVVREPARAAPAAYAAGAASAAHAPHGAVRAVWADAVARPLIVGAAFALLAGYSFGAWNFAYMMRSLALTSQQAGWVAGLSALGSMLAAPLSGVLADRLVRRDRRWQLGVPVIGLALALPLGWLYLAVGAQPVALAVALVIAFAFCIGLWVAPAYAALSLVMPPERRATAGAIVMLVGAVGGGGIGPVLTGAASDWFAARVNGDPLRAALALMLALLLPAMAAFAVAMRAYGATRHR